MIKGMIFDLDGVIVDTAFYHFKAWQYLAKEINISFDSMFNETLKGISRSQSLERILLHGNKANTFSYEEKQFLMNKKNDFYIKLLWKLTKKNILPGVLSFIKTANKHKVLCAIASSSQNAGMILKKLNIKKYFDVIVDPLSLSKGKPDPEIFLSAANLINVLPDEAVGFEDSQAGIEALNKANIFSVGISPKKKLIGASLQVNSFKEINFKKLIRI
ncbi:beta-phosphoglucomutase [Arsenophonus symbiont of Ornithomya chloropus]|uniref:beta-phosphoglucomutase n=1 Tax=Arsenophonus symbiont of Ornithomya chloropus TaxID=634121 RepID=UPI0032B2DDD2